MNKKRILWLDQLRAISFFIVILGHVNMSYDVIKFIYSFHMPLFFIISGMTFRPDKYQSLGKRSKDKFKKLILPHFWMNLLMLPLWIYTFKVLSSASPDWITLLKGIFYINSGKYQSPSNATWFLAALFLTELLFALCYQFSKGNRQILSIAVVILGLIGFLESNNKSNYEGPWHVEAVFTAIVFYMAGYYFMQYLPTITDFLACRKNYFCSLTTLLCIGIWCSLENGRVSMNGNTYDSILYFYAAAFCLSFAIVLIVMKLPALRLFDYVGKNTIAYVGIHIPVIRVIQKTYPIVDASQLNSFLLAVFVYLVMIPITMLINYCFPYINSRKWNFKSTRDRVIRTTISIVGIILWAISLYLLLPYLLK